MSTPLDDYHKDTINARQLIDLLSSLDPETKIWSSETNYDTDTVYYKHLTNVSFNGGFFFGLSKDDYSEADDFFEDEDWEDELEDEIEGELE
jgi:hypothetical protein